MEFLILHMACQTDEKYLATLSSEHFLSSAGCVEKFLIAVIIYAIIQNEKHDGGLVGPGNKTSYEKTRVGDSRSTKSFSSTTTHE